MLIDGDISKSYETYHSCPCDSYSFNICDSWISVDQFQQIQTMTSGLTWFLKQVFSSAKEQVECSFLLCVCV